MNETLRSIEMVWTYFGPFIAAFLTYFIAIKTKKKDLNIEKQQRLNIVLSNLLDSWNYLMRLERLSEINDLELPIPSEILPYFILNSGMLNDKCFTELEESVVLLKEYDPIVYYKLNGIGNDFDYLRTNFIFPFLSTTNKTDLSKKISKNYIQEIKTDIGDYLKLLSKHLGYSTSRKIRKIRKEEFVLNLEDIKEDLLDSYYQFMMLSIPEGYARPTKEEFVNELSRPENQDALREQISLIKNNKLQDIMIFVAEDPQMTVEELAEKLSETAISQQRI